MIVTSADRVLLVRERYDDGELHWGIPSGRVEAAETFAAGAARELAEETGLVVLPERLVEVARIRVGMPDGTHSIAVDFRLDDALDRVRDRDPDAHDPGSHDPGVHDPDGAVVEAAWIDRGDARRLIADVRNPIRRKSTAASGSLGSPDSLPERSMSL